MTARVVAEVLHLTPHLGGGVGKALSGLVSNSLIRHRIACLERPEKSQFLNQITSRGTDVVIAPSPEELAQMAGQADIVQLEWWSHPRSFKALCTTHFPPMRLLVWYHISGLSTPLFPRGLLEAAHLNLFTSTSSLESPEHSRLAENSPSRFSVAHSCGGFFGFKPPQRSHSAPLTAGYVGTLSFSKLHPRFVDYLAAVKSPDFTVRMIGDITSREALEEQARKAGCPEVLSFAGYSVSIAQELSRLDVLSYLLNPRHYGTSENALLEAMAMGVIPIVLDNPSERLLVDHERTGLVVRTPEDFARAIDRLSSSPTLRRELSESAMSETSSRFNLTAMHKTFSGHYANLLDQSPSSFDFRALLGSSPSDWFLSTQSKPQLFTSVYSTLSPDPFELPIMLEQTKSSVFHFSREFPTDPLLRSWAKALSRRFAIDRSSSL